MTVIHPVLAGVQETIPVIAIGGGVLIALVSIVAASLRYMVRERTRGQTQREIAAYVAEGSMTPEEGERLIRAANERPASKCGS